MKNGGLVQAIESMSRAPITRQQILDANEILDAFDEAEERMRRRLQPK